MNIIVCVKAVPAHAENPSIVDGGFKIRVESKSLVMNESDEHALEQALLIKKKCVTTVTVITVGSIGSQDVLHRSLAKGADAGIRVDGDEFDPNIISLKLAHAISKLSYDLIFTGVESLDGMSSQVGISLAVRLEMPFAYAVTKINGLDGGAIVIDRELGGGWQQTLQMPTPALLCIQPGTDSLTYPPAVKLVQVRRRPVPCWSLSDLGLTEDQLSSERKVKLVSIEPRKTSGSIDWLTGTPEQVADRLLDTIKKAL